MCLFILLVFPHQINFESVVHEAVLQWGDTELMLSIMSLQFVVYDLCNHGDELLSRLLFSYFSLLLSFCTCLFLSCFSSYSSSIFVALSFFSSSLPSSLHLEPHMFCWQTGGL